jgi:SsrA-binding protein
MQRITNNKIHHDYEILEKYSCGVELLGHEVKSIKKGMVSLVGGKVLLRGGEVFAIGIDIHPYQENNIITNKNLKSDIIKYDKLRTRRLLMKKSEIVKLYKTLENKIMHLLPYSLYESHGLVKLDIALCKKLNKHDKREKIKERDFIHAG